MTKGFCKFILGFYWYIIIFVPCKDKNNIIIFVPFKNKSNIIVFVPGKEKKSKKRERMSYLLFYI